MKCRRFKFLKVILNYPRNQFAYVLYFNIVMSNENALSIIYTHCPLQILGQRECYISFVIKLYNNYPCMNEIIISDRLVNKMCWVRRNHFFPSDRLRTSTGFGRCQQICVCVCGVSVCVVGGVCVVGCVWWCVVVYVVGCVVCVCVGGGGVVVQKYWL